MCDISFRLRLLATRLKVSLVLETGACPRSGMTAGMGYIREAVNITHNIYAFMGDLD